MNFTGLENVGLSVVIVTLNGKIRLEKTLEYLSKQKDVNFPWELLIIDNNSTDGTVDFVISKWANLENSVELRILKEVQPGTMFARQKGIFESKYRYMLFCDDDNWFNEFYLKRAYDLITSDNSVAAIGGRGIPNYEIDNIPFWLPDVSRYLGCGPQGEKSGDITKTKGCLYTAGAILDRIWLNRLYVNGFISKLKGRDGDSLVAGEDTELTYALVKLGGRLGYCEDMWFYHFIPVNRMEWNYFLRLFKGIGYSDYILEYQYKINFNRWIDLIINVLLIFKYKVKLILFFNSVGNPTALNLARLRGRLKAVLTRWS